MADAHAHAFNALTATASELGIFVSLSDREALAAAVEAATEPEIRADERERMSREILKYKVPCPRHGDTLASAGAPPCWHCSYSAAIVKAARVALGLRWPVPLPGADNEGPAANAREDKGEGS